MSAAQLSLDAYRQKLPTKKAALRQLLDDGRWHTQQEMAKAAGHRFGAALFELHNEADMAAGTTPLHYQKHVQLSDGTRVRYRRADKDACDICTKEAKQKPSELIAQLRKQIEDLKIRLQYAEGRDS
jgi:hypothetical protein